MSPEITPEDGEHLHRLRPLARYQESVSSALRELAQPHVQTAEHITMLPDDPESHPSQKITHVYRDGTPADAETIAAIATASNPNFPDMVSELSDLEFHQKEMSRSLEFLASGGNIVIATNHGDIRDIAEALAAYHVGLRQTAEEQEVEADFATSIMLGKMITHIAIYGLPAVDTLDNLCDRQFFSFPRTKSTENSSLKPFVVDQYNRALRALVKRQLSKGGNLFGIALSGTTDKPLQDETDVIGLGRVSKGTLQIIQSPHTLVLPVAMWRGESDDDSVFEVVDIPRAIRGEEDVHRMMGAIAGKLSELVDGKDFQYAEAV